MWTVLLVAALTVGSFAGALSFRLPREESVFKGRSKCAKCKKKIKAFDNIPVLSYLLLGGKCRSCGKKISPRYFLIEIFTGLLFLIVGLNFTFINYNLEWLSGFGGWGLPYFLMILFFLIVIFVVDWEEQIVPDELVFWGMGLVLFGMIGVIYEQMYVNLLTGFLAAGFFLMLHLVTRGKGMGLGDVKLALLLGTVLGFPLSLVWLFLAFVIGAVVGLVLLALQKVKFGQHIAFGPFMIVSFIITAFVGRMVLDYFYVGF